MKNYQQAYFALLGSLILLAGMLEVLAAIINSQPVICGFVRFSNEAFRGIWGGLVMSFAGIFYLSGIRMFGEVHQLAKTMMGSILLWILAGTDIFALLAGAIPDPQGMHWINTMDGFLKTIAPPYTSAIILLPFSLPIIVYLRGMKNIPPMVDTGNINA